MRRYLLLICLLIFSLLASSCAVITDEFYSLLTDRRATHDQNLENGSLNLYNLVQRLVDALRSDSEIENIYTSIPSKQMDGLELDELQQYVRLIRRGLSGEITSFAKMSEQENSALVNLMVNRLPDQADLLTSMYGVWIYYREPGRSEQRFAVFLHDPENDEPAHLSSAWVRQTLRLADFASLYFDAIDRSDKKALAVLLRDDQRSLTDELLEIKAARIIDFYQNNVSSRTSEFRLTHVRVDSIGFEAFGITNPDQTQAVSRKIELRAVPENRFRILDVIPDVLNSSDLSVYFNLQKLFTLAEVEDDQLVQVRSSDIESLIGPPLSHDDTNCETIGNIQRFWLDYESLEIQVEGTCFRHSRWDGVIQRTILHEPVCRLGSGLRPGSTVEDVLRRFPFAADTNFIISGRFDGRVVRLFIVLNQDVVERMELAMSNF